MAVATKTGRSIQASATNAAAATTTSAALSQITALGLTIVGEIINGATGPTIGCDFVVEIANDGTDWMEFSRQTANTDNNGKSTFSVEIPPSVLHVRTVFTGNTGQAVTIEADGHELTSIT